MQRTLEDFLRALRAVDVRVSPAEAIDAHIAVDTVGYADRELFRDALCATLAKTADEVGRFETCFDTFFARDEFHAPPPRNDPPPSGGPPPPSSKDGAGGENDLAQMLLEDDAAGLAQAMEAAGERAGAAQIRLSSQRRLITRRLLDEMGMRGVEQAIAGAGERGDEDLAGRLAERRQALMEKAARYVERQHDLYAGESGRRMREQLLADEKLTAIDAHQMATMQTLVRRMAKRLAAKYSHQRRRAVRGKLDVRRTLRRSMVNGGVPFDIVWKHKTIAKPKIVAICDVSGSVAAVAQFLLLFLYSLNEAVERLDAFAFSNRLVAVGDILNEEAAEAAIAGVLMRIGMRSTDYGQALQDFADLHLNEVDRHTTVIILGDGRTNYVNPRIDIMRAINERARAVIWLNPEPESFWTRGDSEMEKYRRFCHVAKTCNTLNQLERIIDDVMRTYLPK
jgi:uncharacterized protein with von Willebrand factor type A (vWA) domain